MIVYWATTIQFTFRRPTGIATKRSTSGGGGSGWQCLAGCLRNPLTWQERLVHLAIWALKGVLRTWITFLELKHGPKHSNQVWATALSAGAAGRCCSRAKTLNFNRGYIWWLVIGYDPHSPISLAKWTIGYDLLLPRNKTGLRLQISLSWSGSSLNVCFSTNKDTTLPDWIRRAALHGGVFFAFFELMASLFDIKKWDLNATD